MLPINLDLLDAFARHNPDGSAKDRHAHHRAELLALRRAERRTRWSHRFRRLREALTATRRADGPVCPALPLGSKP